MTYGEGWTEQDDEDLRDGVELGLTLADIAATMERDAEAVLARAEQLGLTLGTDP